MDAAWRLQQRSRPLAGEDGISHPVTEIVLVGEFAERRERAAQFAYPDLEGDAAGRRKSILNVDIHVDTTAGVVALLGRVPLRATAERAEQLAMQNRRRQEKEQSTISGVGD